ncbi:MAG: hypothetical protein EXR07_16405 [Acetobacteraceae bacterium]|nr:hypothetical protein [Acetobacteraceae bacterium]
MSDTHLLQMALGLTPPWTVTGADFDPAARRLDIHMDFPSGSRFACPQCAAADFPVALDCFGLPRERIEVETGRKPLQQVGELVRSDTCRVLHLSQESSRVASGRALF